MMHTPARTRAHRLGSLIVCLAISVIIASAAYAVLRVQSEKDLQRVRDIYAVRTESFINAVFHRTDVLAAAVRIDRGDVPEQDFLDIAESVYTPDSGIRGIQLMPGAVVTMSYPLEGNEEVMGKNFLEIPERRADVQLAIDTREIALSGPYRLLQGGLGLVARNPVFLTDATGQEYFWGFSTIVLDLPDALNSVGLDNLSGAGYDFQLYCVNENGERIVIEGDPDMDMAHATTSEIAVPNHTWTLAIASLHPWRDVLCAAAVFLVCLVLSLGIRRILHLVRQKQAAVDANNRFFSDISHDMRTPLNAVIGFADLAAEPDCPPAEKDVYLDRIRSSGRLLLDIINDMLLISKSGSGKLHLAPAVVRIDTLEDAVVVPLRVLAESGGVQLTYDASACVCTAVEADLLGLEKILLNLTNNAVRFTPAGGHVEVTLHDEGTGETHHLIMVVADDGIGIGADFLPHIFEPFEQERRHGYEGSGTGLGLSIVKEYVDLMGGTVAVESTVDRGTRFTVDLPLPAVSAAEPSPAWTSGEPGADRTVLIGRTVLVCEDNPLNAEIARALLENRGASVRVAGDGSEGLALFEESAEGGFDAILMDVRMPVMDGYAATRAIRALPRADAATVPILAMTADAFVDDIQRCLDAGMDGHIAKPVDAAELVGRIAAAIAARSDA